MDGKRTQKLQLVAEIHNLLEAGDKPLAPATRKAVRLAKLCGDAENELLFQLHLDGVSANGIAGLRVEQWRDPAVPPKWDPVEAFRQDRISDEGTFMASPLEQVESMIVKLEREAERLTNNGALIAAKDALEMEVNAKGIVTRIRNRIANFVGQVEAELYTVSDPVEQAKPKDMENGAMGSNVTKIIVALIGALGLIVVGYFQFGSKNVVPEPVNQLYVGRVTDVANNEPISSAKVSIEADQNIPQIQKTDSEGVFRLSLRPKTQSVVIRVEAEGYETLERNVSVQRTGLEPVGLKRKPASPSPTPTPGRTNKPNSNKVVSATANDLEERKRRARFALHNPSPKP